MSELIERKLGVAAWLAAIAGEKPDCWPVRTRPIILERATLPMQPGDDSQVRGSFLCFFAYGEDLWRGEVDLFVRGTGPEVIEIPRAHIKSALHHKFFPCDAEGFAGVPVWYDFYAVHVQQGGRQWSSHPWQRSLSEFAESRMQTARAKPKKVKVDQLRRLLEEGGAMLPEGPVRFDGEGRIRPGKN